jgi:large subunit ribosomal protein L22
MVQKSKFLKRSHASVMVKGSIEKLQRPLDVIRGISLKEAMNYLFFSSYAASKPLAKLVKSAAANAINLNPGLDLNDLWITTIWVQKDLELRRMKAGPKGRGRPIRKRYSTVYLELGVKEG